MERFLSKEEEKRASISKRKFSFSTRNDDEEDTITNTPTKWKSWDITKIKNVSPKVRARKEMLSVPLELSRPRAFSDKTSVWQVLSRRRNSSGEEQMPGSATKRGTMPLPSIGKQRLRRLSIKAARNSARRRASTSASTSSLKMPELQVSSPTPSENNSPPRRLRRLSMNAARKCAIRRRSLSKSVPKDDHARDLWKKVRSTILAVAMFKSALDCEENTSWASPRVESPTRLAPLSSKVKKRGERRLRRKSPSKKQNALPSLRHSVPSLHIKSTTPW